MCLRGQDSQRGYAMAALLVSLGVMMLLMSVAMPVWRHQAQREKEAELIFRGEQYARAINHYQRKMGPGNFPPSIDVLVQQRFLRKKYKDPMTEDGEFEIIPVGGAMQPGQNPQQPQLPGSPARPAGPAVRPVRQTDPAADGPAPAPQPGRQPVQRRPVRRRHHGRPQQEQGNRHPHLQRRRDPLQRVGSFIFANVSNRPGGPGGPGGAGQPGGRGRPVVRTAGRSRSRPRPLRRG